MSILDIWKITKRLGSLFDMQGFTVAEVEELCSKIQELFIATKDKDSLLRAIVREGRLSNYQKRRKLYYHTRGNYTSKRQKILNQLEKLAICYFEEGNYVRTISQKTIDLFTDELSETTKWRIIKELEFKEVVIKNT